MKILAKKGLTSCLVEVFIQNNALTTGAGLAGLVYNSASLTAYYHRNSAASATAISLVTATSGTWTSSGFVEVDGTNMPGVYQLGIPDAALATGADSVSIILKGATNMAPVVLEVQLIEVDLLDTVRLGLTALPNVASGSAGAIPTTGTGSNQINVSGGRADANALYWNGSAVATPDTAGYPKVTGKVGTGTGEWSLSSGVVKATLEQILGTALTEGAAGRLAAAFIAFLNVAAPVFTAASVNQTGDNFARIGAAGAGLTALGDTRIANLDATVSTRATPAQILTTALTEAYATDGSAATLSQILYMVWSMLAEKSITSTTMTAKKLDGSTTSMTFTLNDASNPTSITRAT